uniref:Mediator of RNA polymerase II transcription subunit 13 n=1 Tax=Heterorhabditis bacteriophora TaxID=37862 RepID=A0A1I7XD37_HETBA
MLLIYQDKCNTENRLESAQHKASMLRSHFPLMPFIPGTRSQNCIPSDTQLVNRCSVSSSPQMTTIVDQMSSSTNNADVMSNSSLEHEISNDLGTGLISMESVILKCETTAELIESNILKGNLRSVVETDLLWMTKALSVTPKEQEGYRVCSVLTFIPPRCFLFSDSEGNMSAARWSAIAELLETHYAAHPSVPGDIEIQPGVECAARNECGEYIRVIIIGQGASSTSFRCAALDYHAMVEIEYSWFMALPRSLSTSFLPANTFLGRIRGIQYVPLEYQSCVGDILNQPFNEQETMPSSCAIFGIDPVHMATEIVTTHSNIEWDGNLGLIMDTQTKEDNDRPEPSCQAETIESEVELEVEVEVQSGLGADSFNNEETEAERTMNSNLCHEGFNIECPIVTPTEITNMAVQMKEFVDQGTVTEDQSDAVVASLDLLSRFISRLPRSASTNSAIIKLIIGLLEVLATCEAVRGDTTTF